MFHLVTYRTQREQAGMSLLHCLFPVLHFEQDRLDFVEFCTRGTISCAFLALRNHCETDGIFRRVGS
jgi:hypothetical protein